MLVPAGDSTYPGAVCVSRQLRDLKRGALQVRQAEINAELLDLIVGAEVLGTGYAL
jgi:hypothetical protein